MVISKNGGSQNDGDEQHREKEGFNPLEVEIAYSQTILPKPMLMIGYKS